VPVSRQRSGPIEPCSVGWTRSRSPAQWQYLAVTHPQYSATLRAIASLDHADSLLISDQRRASGWTPDVVDRVAQGIRACRWLLSTAFDPPAQFGTWLRATRKEAGLGPDGDQDATSSAAWNAAGAVDDLKANWLSEWSMTDPTWPLRTPSRGYL
jgi:hypothetical protein